MANGENLGTINYSVDVDYSALIAAGQAQEKFTDQSRQTATELKKYTYVTSSVTKEYRALKASIDPAYKAQQQFLTGAQMIQKELNEGRITLSQYSKDMANLRRTTQQTAQFGGRFGNVVGGMGGAVQQAGYQVGDFATQIASGQSALVAFTQQGAQIAGVFGPGGAVLGAVLAIGGAIAGYFVRSMGEGEEAAKTFKERIDELNASYAELTANQRESLQVQYREEQEAITQQLTKQQEALAELVDTRDNLLRLQQMAADNPDMIFNADQLAEVERAITKLKGSMDDTRMSSEQLTDEFEKLATGPAADLITSLEDQYLALSLTDELMLRHQLNVKAATEDQRDRALALYAEIQALKDKQQAEEAAATAAENAAARARKAWDDQQKAAESANKLLNQILGVSDSQKFADQWQQISEAVSAGLISESDAKKAMDVLVSASEEAAKESAEKFENPWQSAAESVASSLQDAIASGDWEKLGDAIGNTLATSIAGIVNKTVTDSLAGSVNGKSGMFAQIGAAFAGPVAGAVAGGVAQLAIAEIGDWLSSSDWDPTESRQASQGTGTILGSINDKSSSIAKAVDISAGASRELVGINRDMLRALQVVQIGLGGASAMVARQRGGMEFATSNRYSQAQLAGGGLGIGIGAITTGSFGPLFGIASDVYDIVDNALGGLLSGGMEFLDNLTGGLLSSIGSSVFGGDQKVVDEGIRIIGGRLSDLTNRTLVQAYATIKEDGGWFGSDKRFDRFQDIATNQFALAFESIYDSVEAGAEALGLLPAEIQSRLDRYVVETQRISLEGLSAEEQTAELEAVFSTIFDDLAGTVVPFLDDFQRAGEGLGETLARVATQVQVTQEAVNMLGLRFSSLAGAELIEASERLVELNGGMDQFISNMQNFIGNFATDSQQFAINASGLSRGLGDLPLPETREGFYQLLQAQDAATVAGAENIATLLRLQGTADQYYSAIEKAQTSYFESEIQGQQERLSEARRANQAVQSAMDAMLYQSTAVQETSRQSALRTLEQIASAGTVSDLGTLQNALDAATQIDTGRFSTFADYAREYARTAGVVGRVGDVTQQAESREARMLRSLESQLNEVKGLRDDLERSQLAIIKQTNKTAKILERFEIDGIEVRQ